MREREQDLSAVKAMPAGACSSMPDIRVQIDRVDRALVALIAERLSYIERAAEIKKARTLVRDERRIDDVLSKVSAEARRLGVPENLVQQVWRQLVAGSIAHEFGLFDREAPP